MPHLPIPDDVALRAWALLQDAPGVDPDAGTIPNDGGVRVHLGGPTIEAVIQSVSRAVVAALDEHYDRLNDQLRDDDENVDGALDDVGGTETDREAAHRELSDATELIARGHRELAAESERLAAMGAANYSIMRARVHSELAVADAIDAGVDRIVEVLERTSNARRQEWLDSSR